MDEKKRSDISCPNCISELMVDTWEGILDTQLVKRNHLRHSLYER